ncbi:hypothetical protein JOB18_018682 [Solea senegalensis]|uniref:TRAF3 interacting protein 3 n=1 Tax=Solea senegalensis TaxID=28829 RepID=A0AAV6SQV7_SOLSE|nr:TRAF3-interacting JNK-activating modulator isoform X1 [Solea senegalensis]XP_043893836.1 TRAF3-interacting JNK-activating modulator isoform X1 [Solea senegalensis]KAG7519917.1 hypothetical protein JOB18_018682 [Solea senegalensis]KAG7519918.1 hypothetical protein JOB18_018682 [Solea senegalensis]
MDTLTGVQLCPVKDFDQRVEMRAEKREHMRGRNNVTSCRSPRVEFDTKLIQNEQKDKRQLEYLRRRSLSPELCGLKSTRTNTSPKTMKQHSLKYQNTNIHKIPSNVHKKTIVSSNSSITDGPSTSTWASLWSEPVTLVRQDKDCSKKQASTSTPEIKESSQHTKKRENSVKVQKSSIKTIFQTESLHQKFATQAKYVPPKNPVREAGVQTVSGLVTVKESDVQQLAEYLQEALWREEAMKKKLVGLQESMSDLVNSSNKIWTARCSEDLLRNKIGALEAQLHVCLKFPKDGVKKLMVQMEKQKLIYEEKALVALQRATQEKTEALSKAETLQESLISAKAAALKWQSLYEELKLSCDQLRENQRLSNEQLQQLLSQVELFRAREDELRDEVVSLRQVNTELQYNMCVLEEDNLLSKEEIQNLRDGDCKSQEIQDRLTSQETETQLRKNSQMEEQLRHTQEKLRLKESECEELQTELHAVEQECQSSQARLSQCREELRQISHRRKRLMPCGSWRKVCVFLLLLVAVAGVIMMWMWHPPFREQVEDLYSDIETRIQDYLLEMATPEHSGCFRPI